MMRSLCGWLAILLLCLGNVHSLWAFDFGTPQCSKALEGLSEEAKFARLQLQNSYHHHGLLYESGKLNSADQLLKIFPPAISFSNEAEVWDVIRDRSLIQSYEHPDRYGVSTGLLQSLELLFAGVPKLIMVDAYGPNVAAFALLSEKAKAHATSQSFFAEAERDLQILRSTGEGPSSWFGEGTSVKDFLGTLKSYGEQGFQRFRKAALSGDVKAYLQDLADAGWGSTVREISDNRAPAFVYTSNIFNWIGNQHGPAYAKNLKTLTVDFENKPGWSRFLSKKTVSFGSLIAQTSVVYTGFLHEIAPLWDIELGPTTLLKDEWRSYDFARTTRTAFRPQTEGLQDLNRTYVRVVSRLTDKEMAQGVLKVLEDSVSLNNKHGWDIEVAYDPRLHRIESAQAPQSLEPLLQMTGRTVRFRTFETQQIQELTFDRPQKIIPLGKEGFLLRWKAKDPSGRSLDFLWDPRRYELLEILN